MTRVLFNFGNIMTSSLRTTAGALAALVLLGACSTFDSNVDFKAAKRAKPLEVPPELSAPATDDRFAVPEGSGLASTTFSAYEKNRQTGEQTKKNEIGVMPAIQSEARIERAGSQRWLVVQGSPDKVWVKLKDFWESMAYPLVLDLPAIGIMETDWHEERARFKAGGIRDFLTSLGTALYSTPERNKYRSRLEAGAKAGTTEVYISHRQMYEIYVDEGRADTMWQPQPANPELEAEMLRRFVVFVGVEPKAAQAMLAGAAAPAPAQKSRVLDQDGKPLLELDERFDRAWRRVGLALDRVGFTVEDRNRNDGVYLVRYVDSDAAALRESKESMFAWMAFWRDKPPPPPTQFSVLVKAADDKEKTRVTVSPREGADDPATARKILGLLNEQLK